MVDSTAEHDASLIRPLGERLADSLRADIAPGEEPPPGAHRKVADIIRHWNALRPGPGLLPGRRHFDPIQVPKLLNNIWLVDVVPDDPRKFRARLVGGALIEAGARIRTGMFFDEVPPDGEASVTISTFRELLQTRRINWRRGPSSWRHMEHVRELERVILPLAADGRMVDMFLCLTVFYLANGSTL
jgi:hypothetical protein